MEKIKFVVEREGSLYRASIVKGWFNTVAFTGNLSKSPSGAILSALKGFDFKVDEV